MIWSAEADPTGFMWFCIVEISKKHNNLKYSQQKTIFYVKITVQILKKDLN